MAVSDTRKTGTRVKRKEERRKELGLDKPLNSGRTAPSPDRESRRKVTRGRGVQGSATSQPHPHCQEWGQAQKDGEDAFQSLGQLPFPYFPLIQSGQAYCQTTHVVSIRASCLSPQLSTFPYLASLSLGVPNPQNYPSALILHHIIQPEPVPADPRKASL